jgi:hypothetical protein
MRWKASNLVSGMHALLSKHSESESLRTIEALDDIRQAMLDELRTQTTQNHPLVQMRVNDASDIQDLWYLRGDLMAAIAASDGEAAARQKLAHISEMFRGLVPRGLSSRPSPLGD